MKLGALLVGASLLLAREASAQELPRALHLEVKGDTCMSDQGLREALAIALGSDPIRDDAPGALVVQVLAGESIGRARWKVTDEAGHLLRERTVTVSGGCGVLLRELALSIAVAYETSAPPVQSCDARCREEIRRELIRELRMDIFPVLLAGGLLSAGFTADPGGGAWIGGEVRFGESFSTALEARVLFPSRVVPQPSGEPFELTAVTFALVPCGRWKVLLGCAFADVGMLIGGGVSVPSGFPVLATFGFGPRLAVQIPFGERFGLRAFADLRIAPVASHAGFLSGEHWDSNPVSGLFGLGLTFE